MNKLFKAVKNEIIKLFSKKSTYILIIAAVVLAAFPVVMNKVSQKISEAVTGNINYEYEYQRMEISKYLEQAKLSQTKNYDLIKKMADFRISLLEETKNENTNEFNWKTEIIYYLRSAKTKVFTIDLIREGYNYNTIYEIAKSLYFEINEDIFEYENNTEKLNEEYNNLKNDIEEYTNILKNEEYNEYIKLRIEDKNEELYSYNKKLESLKEILTYEKEEEKVNELKKEIETLNYRVETCNMDLKINKYILDNNVKPTEEDWRNTVLQDLSGRNTGLLSIKLGKQTEKEYYTNGEFNGNDSKNVPYEKYLASYEEQLKTNQNELKKGWYALENNIAINVRNAKTATNGLYDNLVVVLIIIIAGEIVAKEFATGTIRLTLTRPIKRWKILLSKLATVYIMLLLLSIITYIVSIFTGGILYGFSDYGIPDLVINSAGQIIEQNYLIVSLINLIICLLPSIFFVTFTFMLSVVTKSSAISVGASIGGLFAASLTNMILLFNPMKWLQYTPLPYANFSNFLGNMKNTIMQNNIKYDMNVTLENGVIMLLIYIAIFLIISFLTFTKTDIKNQ